MIDLIKLINDSFVKIKFDIYLNNWYNNNIFNAKKMVSLPLLNMTEHLQTLINTLSFSPENNALRLLIANTMMQENLLIEAKEQLEIILQKEQQHIEATVALGQCFYNLQNYSAAAVTLESIEHHLNGKQQLLYAKSLLKDGNKEEAAKQYQQVIALQPDLKDADLDSAFRVSSSYENDDLEFADNSYFMEKPRINFKDVGGMERVKKEIDLKIVQPLKNQELYKAYGKKIGGGILLYGPPGCGKTFIARATAGEINAKFISIGLHDVLDMWIGNSEKNLHEIFELARRNAPCVLFFDEVDAIGASRRDVDGSAMKNTVNQLLFEMDGAEFNNDGVLILAATNAPWSVDAAFRRPGRFDRVIFVAPPDEPARAAIFKHSLSEKPTEEIDYAKIAAVTDGYSGADIMAVIDIAIEQKIEASIASGIMQPIATKDILQAIKAHRNTTLEWFSGARNYALYSNESGLYDDILHYLKIKK